MAEAFGGLRYVTGEPDRPPVRPNLSLGDSVAGLHAALGILMALYHRDAKGGVGQVIDVALYETVLNLMGRNGTRIRSGGRETRTRRQCG